MIERNKIQEFVDEVVRQFHPERVVLFGEDLVSSHLRIL